MTKKQKPEKQTYVDNVTAGRIEIMQSIEKIRKAGGEYNEHEDFRDPLSLDTVVEKKILLSWGGPEDGFKLYFTIDCESKQSPPALKLWRGVYYRADWGAYEETDLSDDEAQTVYDFYLGGYTEI